MSTRELRTLWLAMLFTAAAMASTLQSDQTAPIIRAQSRLVLVRLVATRADGSMVNDLQPGELRLAENGRPQIIESLEPIESNASTDKQSDSQDSAHPSKGNYPHFSFVLLDALNTPWADQSYARNAVRHLIDYFPDNEQMALLVLTDRLSLLHDFSSNPAVLRATLNGLASETPNSPDTTYPEDDLSSVTLTYSQLMSFSNRSHLQQAVSSSEIRFYQRRRILQTCDALRAIANLAKQMPGQKDLLWVTGGFPLTVRAGNDPLDGDSYLSEVERAARALSSAGVRIYAIDARGLSVNSNASINIATMQLLVDETGGEAFFNNNDLPQLMHQALDESRGGYMLSYTPTDHRDDGTYHTIHIQVLRKGVKLRYRSGYFAEVLR